MSNGWNKQIEKVLVNWARQIALNEDTYRGRGVWYNRGYNGIGVVLVFTQTTALMTLLTIITQYATRPDADLTAVLICIAIVDTAILILQGLDKFWNFGSKAEKHFEAAKDHNALNKLIVSTLTLDYSDRDSAREYMESIRRQFQRLQEDSPNLPNNKVINQLEIAIYERVQTARETTLDGGFEQLPKRGEHGGTIELPTFNTQQRKVQEALTDAKTDKDQNILKNLDYQWRRLVEHM